MTIGNAYRYDVKAIDSDGELLTYSLDAASIAKGMKIDQYGRITWQPKLGNVGAQAVMVTVKDPNGAQAVQNYSLAVLADTSKPVIELTKGTTLASLGETVVFQVAAMDNVGIQARQLLVNGEAIALDSNGLASYKVTSLGVLNVQAIVTDVNGNISTQETTVNVYDPTDATAPQVQLVLPSGNLTNITEVRGSVTDTNLDYYVLEVASLDSDNWRQVFRGTANVTDGVLGKFDPTGLLNDTYRLRLTAYDTNGAGNSIEQEVEVAGELKLGNFRLSFTDMTIPVTGIPISVTRTYDSLASGTRDDFGYGWRMEFRDTDLRTSLKKDPTYEQLEYRTEGFNFGTRIYITLPGGKREGFTFQPQQVQGEIGGFTGGRLYFPAFVADKGVTSRLTVPDAEIVFNPLSGNYTGNPNGVLLYKDGKLFNLGGRPYVPQDSGFGNRYLLTTKDGTVYEINATSGDLESVKDTNGNKLTYSDTEIVSSTGQKVVFDRDAQGRITAVTDPLGQKVQYKYDAKGDLVGVIDQDGNETNFEYDATRSHYLNKIIDSLGREAVKTEYDEQGRLKKTLDINGNGTAISYDPDNSSQTVLDAYGKPTTYIYDSRGNILQEIDAFGGITKRTYDEDSNELTVTDADGVTMSYTYDSNRNMTSFTDGNGNVTRLTYGINNKVTSVTTPSGLVTTATYDSRGNLLASKDIYGLTSNFTYDDAGRPLTTTEADGQVTTWAYDTKGNPISMADSRGNTVKSSFNANGKIEAANSQFTLNGQAYTLSSNYIYDLSGRVISNSNSKGNSHGQTYNSIGQLVTQTDELGNVTTFKYDEKGQLIEQILPDNTPNDPTNNPVMKMTYDLRGNKLTETTPTGLVFHYVYDDLGQVVESIIPDETPNDLADNPRLITEYTKAGRVKSETDIYGNKQEYTYNNLGQVAEVKDILGNVTKYAYDRGGKIISVIDPRNRQTTYSYDGVGRLVTTTYFDGSTSKLTYDELNRVKTETNGLGQTNTYSYDLFGKVSSMTDAAGKTTTFEYDQRRNLVKVTDANGHSLKNTYDQYARRIATTFDDGAQLKYEYDRLDRLTATTDENGNKTEYSYDNLDQIIKIKQANGAETKYEYDKFSRIVKTIDPNGHATQYEYDAFDRVTATVLALGQRDRTIYDKYGQVASTTDFNGDTINYGYDRYGRLTGETFTNTALSAFTYAYDNVTSQLTSMTDGTGTTLYNYDVYDRLAQVTNPDGKFVKYGYDILDNLISVQTQASTTNYSYDVLNRLTKVKDGSNLLATYTYDNVGNLVRTQLADGTTETRSYDMRDRLTQITDKNSVGYVYAGFTYTLDAVGNRTKVVEANGRMVDYQYDNLNRLTSEQITSAVNGNRNFGYIYDLAGNRLTKTDSVEGTTAYTYDANNRLTQTAIGTTVNALTYDLNGSLLKVTDGTNTTLYTWANDGENRLLSVNDGTNLSRYVYNGMGDRVASIDNGVRTNYLTAGSLPQVVLEYNTNGITTADYTLGLDLIRRRADGREGYYHTDGLGSTRVITDNVGLVLNRYDYDAFGVTVSETAAFGNSFQFAGEQKDSSGLSYNRARYYNSSTGRFISKDPYSGDITDPYSQHGYQYAHGNPVRYTDPTGYFTSIGDAMTAISIASIIVSSTASAGYVGAKYLLGQISADDIYGLFGDWVAGYSNGVTGGISADIQNSWTGTIVKPRDGFLFAMGNVAGIGTSFLIGLGAPIKYGAKIGQASFSAIYQVVVNGYGAGKGIGGVIVDGRVDTEDAFNLLNLLPFGGSILGSVKGVAGMRAANTGGGLGTLNSWAETAVNSLKSVICKLTNKCFEAGTEILTAEGSKNIEDIQVGDWVLSENPVTGEIEYKQVTDTFVRQAGQLVDLYVDGQKISTTGEHPFWTTDKGWVEAKALVVGSLVMTEDGRIVDIDGIETRTGEFTVYNFSVEDFHSYFVSDLGILVHNATNYLKPDPNAQNWHAVYKLDNETRQIRSYQEFIPNTPTLSDGSLNKLYNPQYPKPWIPGKRVDLVGDSHFNRVLGMDIETPHVNGKDIPGGVRAAEPWEIPSPAIYPR